MKVALLGDIALHGQFGRAPDGAIHPAIHQAAEFLAPFDLVIGNLETPLVRTGRPFGAKSAHLGARPEDVAVLEVLGVHALSVANNHTFDFGPQGFEETLEALESAGIAAYGFGGKAVVLERKGQRLQLHGFCCYTSNPVGLDPDRGPARLNALSVDAMNSALEQALTDEAFPILSLHWGEEHVHSPRWEHVELARRSARKGPYLLHGHHPHVLQGIEQVQGSLLAYSLGNFCFDAVRVSGMKKPLVTPTPASRETGILEVEISDGTVADWRFHPLRFEDGRFSPDPTVLQNLEAYSRRLASGARDPEAYQEERARELAQHRARRRGERSLEWLRLRLRPRTLLNRIEARKNRRLFDELIAQPLTRHS